MVGNLVAQWVAWTGQSSVAHSAVQMAATSVHHWAVNLVAPTGVQTADQRVAYLVVNWAANSVDQ